MRTQHPHRNSQVKSSLLPDGHLVIFDEETNWAQTLNPVAAIIWELSDGNHAAEDIQNRLAALGASVTIDEVNNFISELCLNGYLHLDKDNHCLTTVMQDTEQGK